MKILLGHKYFFRGGGTSTYLFALMDYLRETVSEYDVEELKTRRRRGRPPMGSGPAEVLPVRIDPELRAAIEARAEKDHTTASDVIREAIRRFLDVA